MYYTNESPNDDFFKGCFSLVLYLFMALAVVDIIALAARYIFGIGE
jgi:hypothetical protein